MKGVEVSDCDTLVVEGRIEATLDSRVLEIAEKGVFSGVVAVDSAEIRGRLEGELTVRKQLVVHATGRLSGKIRYARIKVEEGAELSGEISVLDKAPAGAMPKRIIRCKRPGSVPYPLPCFILSSMGSASLLAVVVTLALGLWADVHVDLPGQLAIGAVVWGLFLLLIARLPAAERYRYPRLRGHRHRGRAVPVARVGPVHLPSRQRADVRARPGTQ